MPCNHSPSPIVDPPFPGSNKCASQTYAALVAESFGRARHCQGLARAAHHAGDCAQVRKWMWSVRVLRLAAAEWRQRAQCVAPVFVCLLWCLGCAKAPSREFDVDFNVQPSPDGTSVAWSLKFTRANFDAMLKSTPGSGHDINVLVHQKVRALIAAGLESHELAECNPHEQVVAKLDDGIAFLGTCPIVGAHVVPAANGI